MMNIRNLGSKESARVKSKAGICAKLCLRSGLKATGIFVILLSQDGFESDSPEKSPKQSLPKVTSDAAVCRCSSK